MASDLKVIWSDETNCFRLDPLPSKEELKSFYEKDFYSIEKPDYVKEEEEDREWHEMAYGDRVDQIKALMTQSHIVCDTEERPVIQPFFRALEVGCGTGRFLKYIKDHASVVTIGIEPDKRLCDSAVANGVTTVFHGTWDNNQIFAPKGYWDVIFAHFVLEHLLEPVKFLRWAHDLLSENGILYLAVPNDFTDIQQRAAAKIGKPNYWLHKTHLQYWGFSSLEGLLRREGFEPVARDCTMAMEAHILQGQDYVSEPALGRAVHWLRVETELAMDKRNRKNRREVFKAMAENGGGRDAIIYSRKV